MKTMDYPHTNFTAGCVVMSRCIGRVGRVVSVWPDHTYVIWDDDPNKTLVRMGNTEQVVIADGRASGQAHTRRNAYGIVRNLLTLQQHTRTAMLARVKLTHVLEYLGRTVNE